MKKKSLVAMGLAGVMTVGMCVPVLAADNTFNQDSADGLPTVVSIIEPVSYSVTIPKEVTLNKGNEGEISVILGDDAILETTGNINVAISGLDESNTLKLQSGDGTEISSMITPPEKQTLNKDGKVIKYKLGAVAQLANAGKYNGNITFTISYVGTDFTIPAPPAVE